ncbi:MAG: hypothetical protein ACFE9S_01660 [Candidatus Hermodarchaeota archaeon]
MRSNPSPYNYNSCLPRQIIYGLIQMIDEFKLLDIIEKPTYEEILNMKN